MRINNHCEWTWMIIAWEYTWHVCNITSSLTKWDLLWEIIADNPYCWRVTSHISVVLLIGCFSFLLLYYGSCKTQGYYGWFIYLSFCRCYWSWGPKRLEIDCTVYIIRECLELLIALKDTEQHQYFPSEVSFLCHTSGDFNSWFCE